MILPIFLLLFSLAHSSENNNDNISDDEDPKISSHQFLVLSDGCKTANSLYELYSIFSITEIFCQNDEIRQLKSAIVKRFSELHASKNLAETLKGLIIRDNHSYVHFYCAALTDSTDIYSSRNFGGLIQVSEAIIHYFEAEISAMYREKVPIDFHVMELMITIIERFVFRRFKSELVSFWKTYLKSGNFYLDLLKNDPHAQFEEIIRKYSLEGDQKRHEGNKDERKIIATNGFFALKFFSKTHFIRNGQIVDWNFVNSLSPRRLFALFYAYLEGDMGRHVVSLVLKIQGSKINEKSLRLEKFLICFFTFYHGLLDKEGNSKDENENILGLGYRLRGLFKSPQIWEQFLFRR
jgi:hypothetical protein